jgi:hypothetical protein
VHLKESKGSIPWSKDPTSKINPYYAISPCFFKTHITITFQTNEYPSSFPTETLNAFQFFPICATCPANLIFLHLITLIIIW